MSMLPYFPYDPFEWWPGEESEPYRGVGGESSGFAPQDAFARWLPSAAMREADPWRYDNWINPNNMTVLSGNSKDGYEVMVKTGDKEGTVYHLLPDDKGGYVSKEVGKRSWDTNGTFLDKWGPLLPLLGAAIAAAAPSIGGWLGAGGAAEGGAAGAGAAGAGTAATDPLIWETTIGTGAAGAPPAMGGATVTSAGAAAGGAGAAAGSNSLVKWLVEETGLGEGVITAMLGLTPAVLTAVEHATRDPEDSQVKTTGDPVIDTARRGLVSSYMDEFPALRQRTREVSDQLLGYASNAAAIPSSLPPARGIMEVDPETGKVRLRRPGGLFG